MAGNARRLVYFATAVSALGGFLFGYDIGVISGAILFINRYANAGKAPHPRPTRSASA